MAEYYRCEANGCHMIDPYIDRYHCEGFSNIYLKGSNKYIKEERLEETVTERNT